MLVGLVGDSLRHRRHEIAKSKGACTATAARSKRRLTDIAPVVQMADAINSWAVTREFLSAKKLA
jgi:hypothetical protein